MRKTELTRALLSLLLVAGIIFLIGCGGNQWRHVSSQARATDTEIVNAIDVFLDTPTESNAREALTRIEALSELPVVSVGDPAHNELSSAERESNTANVRINQYRVLLRSDLGLIGVDFSRGNDISERYERMLERRNRLAARLGMDER